MLTTPLDAKTPIPTLTKADGREIYSRDVHPSKAYEPIEVTLDGISTSRRLLQFEKVYEGI